MSEGARGARASEPEALEAPAELAALLPAFVAQCWIAPGEEPLGLHPEEAALTERYARKRTLEFAAGRRCARAAAAKLGLRLDVLLPDEDRVPIWPSELVGSITHCAGFCAAALSLSSEALSIGIDAEPVGAVRDDLLVRILRPAERAALGELRRNAPGDWATLYFSAKEAAYKAYFPLARRRLGFDDMEITFAPAGSFEARLVRDDAPAAAGQRAFAGRFVETNGRVHAAVAVLETGTR